MIIGLVCEGPRDYDMLSAAVKKVLPGTTVRPIQPDAELTGTYGFGWKGVWRWCRDNGGVSDDGLTLKEILSGIEPPIDYLLIQMDADVSRKDRESHCGCAHAPCQHQQTVVLPDCQHCGGKANACPISLPCPEHTAPEDYVQHLSGVLGQYFPEDSPVLFVIPCDSMDAWIVAGFEPEVPSCEQIHNPWGSVISSGRTFHGIRVKGEKSSRTYRELIAGTMKNWEQVTRQCPQAAKLVTALQSLSSAT